MDSGLHDLGVLLKSRVPLIVIETTEERRVLDLFRRLALRDGRPVLRWSVASGLQRVDLASEPRTELSDPARALQQIRDASTPAIYLMLDFHPYFAQTEHVRMVKEIALGYGAATQTLVFISHACTLPEEVRSFGARFELHLPDPDTLTAWLNDEARQWARENPGRRVRTDDQTLKSLVAHLNGLTEIDARRLIRSAIHDDGAITESDFPPLVKAKYELLDQGGVLAFELDTARFADIGGLRNLRRWLERRRPAFVEPQHALDPPRGILLVGVQGAGKSLAAKAVAGLWRLPLLRLDFGVLYNKFFGETERNLRSALHTAESMSPCVLWVDELEKGIASGDYDSGTSKRVLGTLLTWLAERRKPVFLVATANRIDALPPELIRKGRLDEIFFVDLPDTETRARIFAIHLRKRGQQPTEFELDELARCSDGFSGAEIEQAIVAALYKAREQQRPLDGEHLLSELRQTRPLSVVMSEHLTALRHWALERTVPAD